MSGSIRGLWRKFRARRGGKGRSTRGRRGRGGGRLRGRGEGRAGFLGEEGRLEYMMVYIFSG